MQQPENDLFNRPPEVMLALILNEFNSIASRMGTPLDLLRRFQDNPQAIQRYTKQELSRRANIDTGFITTHLGNLMIIGSISM